MDLYNNKNYIDDVDYVGDLDLPWDKLKNSSILLSGATGLIGSFLIDVIMEKNLKGMNCMIYAMTRNVQKAKMRFEKWQSSKYLNIIEQDVNSPIVISNTQHIRYILHMASNTHPLQYSIDPIGTILTNVIGLKNMLDFSKSIGANRFLFASSNEIYGENRGDIEFFDESYCGYINSNTLRAGYPESKRCGEALCQAYITQEGLDIVIARLTRSYGPTMLQSDSKAISQFIKKGVAREDIVLKSEGKQFYSYTYVADAVSGILTILLKGNSGEAYNIADEKSDISLKNLATLIATYAGTKVVYEIPSSVERNGYSTATKARLSGNKLKQLGWEPKYDISEGIYRTLQILSY